MQVLSLHNHENFAEINEFLAPFFVYMTTPAGGSGIVFHLTIFRSATLY